jgi:hypothetical protein
MALSGLEIGLAIALGIVCLVLTVILMYYFIVYKSSKRLNATEIFTAFKNLKDIKKQISVAKDVEIYLREADVEMRKNQAEISSLVDEKTEKTEKTVDNQFYGDRMLN